MTTTLVQLPDAELLTIEALLAQPEVTSSALGTRIYSIVPKKRTFPLARVSRYGGAPLWDGDPMWADHPSLQVDVWSEGGTVEARSLAELLQACCVQRLPGVWANGVIVRAQVTGLVQGADPTFEPPKPRYRFSAMLLTHPVG